MVGGVFETALVTEMGVDLFLLFKSTVERSNQF